MVNPGLLLRARTESAGAATALQLGNVVAATHRHGRWSTHRGPPRRVGLLHRAGAEPDHVGQPRSGPRDRPARGRARGLRQPSCRRRARRHAPRARRARRVRRGRPGDLVPVAGHVGGRTVVELAGRLPGRRGLVGDRSGCAAAAVLPRRPAAEPALALGAADVGRMRRGHPGLRRGGPGAVHGSAGGPRAPVRGATGLVRRRGRCSLLPDAGAGPRLRLVAGAALPPRRPVAACPGEVAGPGRRRSPALPAVLPPGDRPVRASVVDERRRRSGRSRGHPGGDGRGDAAARPLRRRQGARGDGHLGAADSSTGRRLPRPVPHRRFPGG